VQPVPNALKPAALFRAKQSAIYNPRRIIDPSIEPRDSIKVSISRIFTPFLELFQLLYFSPSSYPVSAISASPRSIKSIHDSPFSILHCSDTLILLSSSYLLFLSSYHLMHVVYKIAKKSYLIYPFYRTFLPYGYSSLAYKIYCRNSLLKFTR
jgi:hypothetical protein